MIARSLQSIVFVILMSSIAACEESSEVKLPASDQPEADAIPWQVQSYPKKASEILAAFRRDIAVCISAMAILNKDQVFIDEYSDAQKRESKPLEEFLRQSDFSTTEDIQYLRANLKYFLIDLDNHQNMMAVAWAGNTGVFCAPSELRLDEIEALGESPDAWEVRQNFLERGLENLIPTGSVSGDSEGQFEYFKMDVEKAARVYTLTQRSKFIAWVKKAIEHIEMERNFLTTDAGMTLAEQNEIIDRKVAFLQGFVAK